MAQILVQIAHFEDIAVWPRAIASKLDTHRVGQSAIVCISESTLARWLS